MSFHWAVTQIFQTLQRLNENLMLFSWLSWHESQPLLLAELCLSRWFDLQWTCSHCSLVSAKVAHISSAHTHKKKNKEEGPAVEESKKKQLPSTAAAWPSALVNTAGSICVWEAGERKWKTGRNSLNGTFVPPLRELESHLLWACLPQSYMHTYCKKKNGSFKKSCSSPPLLSWHACRQ